MKILALFQQNEARVPGVWQELIDSNERYTVSIMHLPAGVETAVHGSSDLVQTSYIIEGSLDLTVYQTDGSSVVGSRTYQAGSGWSLLPGQKQQMKMRDRVVAFVVSGKVGSAPLVDARPAQINELSAYL